MISGNWFIFIIIGLIVYLLATVFCARSLPRIDMKHYRFWIGCGRQKN